MAFILIISIWGCGLSSSRGRSGYSAPVRVLSEAEKQILATTTIYYVETFSAKDMSRCSESEKINLLDRANHIFARACKKVFDSCLMEGTCLVTLQNKLRMLNVDGVVNNIHRFRDITNNECTYGRGASADQMTSYKSMCVDPFYSVAADLNIYNLGDVIYLPVVRGTVLPDGSIHDGYFIVRDNGGGIKGHGRFDFFTGFFTNENAKNPFINLKLNGLQTFPEYFLVEDEKAAEIRKQRNFPLLPKFK
jgi:3D (Asp-Asp-Asp) domain-containing protein